MSKVIKSGKLDNVIASMDAGKHYIVKMRDGTVTAIEKTGLPEKIRVCLGNGCFIAGTLVTTRSGLKPIEEIKIGDYVLSRNEETGENSYKKITDTLVRSTQEICTIELENGKIRSTTGHLFMVKDKWWKAAVELEVGDILATSDGNDQIVKSIKVEEKGYPVTTYNLTVEDNHTFFVGNEEVLTHNTTNMLNNCNYTKEISEGITERVSKPKIGKTGEGIPLEEVKPDVLKQIHYDENGAYGYLPNEGTAYHKPEYDFTNVDWAKEMQNVRKDYLEASKQLEIDIERMTSEGFSKEDIAKHVVDARNQQKVTARANMTAEEVAGLEARNIELYGNPIGPDSQWLFNRTKKKLMKDGLYINDNEVWKIIIGKSMVKDDVINTLLGLIH